MSAYSVIGLGQFGRHLAVTLGQLGHEVLAIDTDMARIDDVKDLVARAVCADASREETVRAVGAHAADVAIVALGEEDFEAAVLAVAVLKGLGTSYVVARSSDTQRGRILTLVGADRVVYPETEMAERLARTLGAREASDEPSLPSGHTFAETRVPAPLVGQTLAQADVRGRYGLNVLAIRRRRPARGGDAPWTSLPPTATEKLEPEDVLVVVADRQHLEAFARVK